MTVYEATTREHYEKIAKFILQQPEDSMPFICWQQGFKGKGHLPEFIEILKKQKPYLHILWSEDDAGEVRAVISLEIREIPNPLPWQGERLATMAFICVSNEDFENDNTQYHDELLDFLIREYSGITKPSKINAYVPTGEFWAYEKYYRWAQKLFKDSLTFIEEREVLHGKIFRYKLDFKKYLGVT